MKDWLAHLDRHIDAMGAQVLTNAGSVSHQNAVATSEREYDKLRKQIEEQSSGVERAYLEPIKHAHERLGEDKA